jgi:hypothetical protein
MSENPNEQLFRRYLDHHKLGYEFEPALPTRKRPDFKIWRDEAAPVVVEVEGFSRRERPPRPFQRAGASDPAEDLKPLRTAIKNGAAQLHDLADEGLPLVVALDNAEGAEISLSGDDLQLAIEGNPAW